MSEKKLDPEGLTLRVRPQRVIRFKRPVVIGIAAIACSTVLGTTWLALRAPGIKLGDGKGELYATDRKPMPDSFATLPKGYGQMAAKSVPTLGAPLPGDLGRPVLRQEQREGVVSAPETNLRPNPEEDAARAERLRLAQQARQAREAGVFFQVSRNERGGAPATPVVPASASAPATPIAATATDRFNLDPGRDPNGQQRKLDFLAQPAEREIYNPHALQDPVSPYEVMAGSVIAASLLTGINSDLPGAVTAQVTEDVYDTVTGRILLIPQGTRLIGAYDSVVAFGQSRALLVWQRLILPDGSSIQIDNLPATDTAGYSGLEDQVDVHTWQLLKGVVLSTLLGTGSQVTFGNAQSNLVQAIRESTQDSVNQAGQRLVEKDLNIQPTITIRPGWPLRVIVHKDLVLRPYLG